MSRLCGILALMVLAGCTISGPERACTMIGSDSGVGVTVADPVPAELASNSVLEVEACWEAQCETVSVTLSPETEAVPEACSGTSPPDSCSASMQPTGGLHGFASFGNLPAEEVEVSAAYGTGDAVNLAAVQVLIDVTYPNGEQCGPGGNQGAITIQEGVIIPRR